MMFRLNRNNNSLYNNNSRTADIALALHASQIQLYRQVLDE